MNANKTTILLFTFLIAALSCNGKNTTTISGRVSKGDLATPSIEEVLTTEGVMIHEPIQVQNLSLFMLSGETAIPGKIYTTLSRAMQEKTVTVHETGSVNELSIDNTSDDYIFIHSGDIVKGGKQDRTIAYDVIVPPRAKNVGLASFCVEQGRWQQRANETVTSFGSNTKMVSSRDLKLAARYDKDQAKVWRKVAEQKSHLNKKLSEKNGYTVNVADSTSNTSLQLALENKSLKQEKKAFYEALAHAIQIPNAIGYAYAINGEIYGVERYNNTALFEALWEKLLESIIVEAISTTEDSGFIQPTSKMIKTYMEAVNKDAQQSMKKINATTTFKTISNTKEGNLLFITEDTAKKEWIHRSFMKGDTRTAQKKGNQRYRNVN
ncbi:ARPP-1 family domain-containing protein [Spongiimicrobium salis]|uniref:ARPP-1 family domain-containing protein n=1 Tax=Spongiimicrobium salis TaxID=1667022 RepID=UPI00374DE1A1